MPADERDILCDQSSIQKGSDLATTDYHLVNRVRTGIGSGVAFVRRQPRQWIVTAVRSSLAMFLYTIVAPYLSVYTMDLGASATQLGIVNSVGTVSYTHLTLPTN